MLVQCYKTMAFCNCELNSNEKHQKQVHFIAIASASLKLNCIELDKEKNNFPLE